MVHLVAEQDSLDSAELAGTGIGEWVAQLVDASSITPLPDRVVADRPHWLVSFPAGDGQGEVVLFIDQEHLLPTAVELRQEGRALLSSGYTELVLNPQLPESTFRIRPLFNVPTVEVAWDPTVSPAVAADGLP